MCQALREEDITVYGNGEQTRSFTYVDDTVAGIIALLESDCTDPVNIGNPGEVSIIDFAREIVELTGSSSGVVQMPFPEGFTDDPKVRRPDISRARERLGWEPKVDRGDGLRLTVAYFRQKLGVAE